MALVEVNPQHHLAQCRSQCASSGTASGGGSVFVAVQAVCAGTNGAGCSTESGLFPSVL